MARTNSPTLCKSPHTEMDATRRWPHIQGPTLIRSWIQRCQDYHHQGMSPRPWRRTSRSTQDSGEGHKRILLGKNEPGYHKIRQILRHLPTNKKLHPGSLWNSQPNPSTQEQV